MVNLEQPRPGPIGLRHDTRANDPKDDGTSPWQILDVYLSPLTQIELWCGAVANGRSIRFPFHPSKERQNITIGVFSPLVSNFCAFRMLSVLKIRQLMAETIKY